MPQDLGLVFGPRKPVFGPRFWALFPPGLPQFLLLTAAALRPSIHRGDAYLKYEFKWASPSVAPLKNGPTPKAFRRKTYLENDTFAVVSAGRAGPGRFEVRFFRHNFGNRRAWRAGITMDKLRGSSRNPVAPHPDFSSTLFCQFFFHSAQTQPCPTPTPIAFRRVSE